VISIYILAIIETPFSAFLAFFLIRTPKKYTTKHDAPCDHPMVRHHTAEKCERGAERKRMAVRASFLRLANMTKNKWRAGGRAGGDPRSWLLRCVVAVRERGQTRVHQTKKPRRCHCSCDPPSLWARGPLHQTIGPRAPAGSRATNLPNHPNHPKESVNHVCH